MNDCSVLTESSFILKTGEAAIELERVLKHVHVQLYEMITEGVFVFFFKTGMQI